MRLYLIRHGQSENNILTHDTINLRKADPNLTDIGQQQAAAVADYLCTNVEMPPGNFGMQQQPGKGNFGITHLYTSAMRRTLQTTAPIAKALNMQPQIWTDLHEHGGIWLEDDAGTVTGYGGMTRQQISEEFEGYAIPDNLTDAGWWRAPGGRETVDAFLGRAIRVALELQKRSKSDDCIVLVAHAAFLDGLIKALLGQIPRHPGELFYAHYNTGITRFDFEDGIDRMRLHYLNRVEHLSPELRSW
ncbi:MAG: histidine phosphatase family protein [Aggregatilineales bacterium]